MPNAQAENARVLAIEPEGSQAEAIRQFVRDELGAELERFLAEQRGPEQ